MDRSLTRWSSGHSRVEAESRLEDALPGSRPWDWQASPTHWLLAAGLGSLGLFLGRRLVAASPPVSDLRKKQTKMEATRLHDLISE